MVPLDALMQLSVANWTKVNWVTICLLKMVGALHQALVPSAVPKAEHMAKFVRGDFANSHEHGVFFLLWARVSLLGPPLSESVDALDTTF